MSASPEHDPEFSPARPKARSGPGCTLIELLVVLSIIAVLVALCMPAIPSRCQAGPRAQCVNNMKQIALALHNYEAANGVFPPAYTVDAQGRPLHSWRTLILPYLEQDALCRTIDLTKPWNDPANARALHAGPSVFHCPSSGGPRSTTTYLAVVGPNACFLPTRPRRMAEITDPHESTLTVIEAAEEDAVPWMAPLDADESLVIRLGASSKPHHLGGMNAAFADGGVKLLKAGTPATARRAMISISGDDYDRTEGC